MSTAAPAKSAAVAPAAGGAAAAAPAAAATFSESAAPPVHNLAVKSEVVPQGRRRQSVIAGGQAKMENVVDLTKTKEVKGAEGVEPPSIFVLVSETSLYAGVPGQSGAIDGPADVAKFNTPSDIVVDRNQQLFIADTDNARIRRISKQGAVSTVAAIGGGDGDIDVFPHGLAFDHNGAMYILQSGAKHQIFQVAPGQGVTQLAGSNTVGFVDTTTNLLEAAFNHPRATGVDSQNRIYICDKGNNAIRRIDKKLGTVITLTGPGGIPLDLLNPEGITVDQYDDLFIADTGHHRILKVVFSFDEKGNEVTEVSNYCGKYGVASYANGPAAGTLLHSPTGLVCDRQNHLWICDSGNNCIRMMAHGAELLFTVSGKGSIEQEKMYNYPTSIALSYDAMYGADMADTCPDVVRNDPNHPLYYSYITPVIFVADSGSHCIRKIHTVMMESAKALIDVCTPSASAAEGEDYPMHNALSYGVVTQRNPLMKTLLELKPQLLQQKNKEERIPLHIACMESATITAGTISLDIIHKMLGQADPNAYTSIMTEDKEKRIPLSYALECMELHALNIAADKLEYGEDADAEDNPDLPFDASRQLMCAMLALAPDALFHPSCQKYTLHTLIAAQVPLKFLKKFAQAIEDTREQFETDGMLEANFTTMFELKAEALQKYPNPFFVRNAEGKLPIHVAAEMHAQGTPVSIDVLMWLILVSQLPPTNQKDTPSIRTRDLSLKAAQAGKQAAKGVELVEGHFPMFYACTLPRAAAPNAAPNAAQLHKPLHKIPPAQKLCIEYMLDAWPESILQNEAAGVLHASPFQATSMKPATFLEWVFYHKSIELLEIFCKRMPQCLDRYVWFDSQDVITPKESEASEIGKDGRKKRRNSAGPNTLTMLHSAAKINDYELLEVLLKNNANPFLNDKRDKIPIDWVSEDKCRTLLQTYMDKDPRKPIVPTVTMEIGCQTDKDEEAAAEKARLEKEAARILEKEAELARQAEEDGKKRAAELAAAQAKLAADAEAEKQRLAAEAEAEKQRLAAEAEAEKKRLADAAEAEKQRLAAEAEAEKQRLASEAEAEKQRLAAEAEAEKQRLAALEAEKDAARAKLEAELKAAAEAEAARMAAEAARLAAEAEAEKKRLNDAAEAEKARLAAEAEAEKQRLAALEAEKDAARAKLEADLKAAAEAEATRLAAEAARLAAETEAEKQRLAAEAEAERQRLAQLEAERQAAQAKLEADMRAAEEARIQAQKDLEAKLKQEQADKDAARAKLEADLKAAAEAEAARLAAEAAAEKARLAAEAEAEKQRLAQLEAEKDAARAQLEADLKAASEAEAARLAAEAARLAAETEAEKARLAAEAEAERQRVAQLEAERQAAQAALEAEMRAAEEARIQAQKDLEAKLKQEQADKDAARAKLEADLKAAAEAEAARLAAEAEAEKARLAAETEAEKQRLAFQAAERDAEREKLEADLKAAAEAERARLAAEAEKERNRLQDETEAERLRLAALEAEREAARLAREAAEKQRDEEAEERERLRNLKNQKLQEQRDASRAQAEEAEKARIAAEEELARLRALMAETDAAKKAAEAAAAAAEAARLAAEADAEEARRRREHQWNLNAEHEERLRKEQEAAIAARPPSASKELGDLKRVPQKKKQSPAELAALARAQAAIEAAAAKRDRPKPILGFGSSTIKNEAAAAAAAAEKKKKEGGQEK